MSRRIGVFAKVSHLLAPTFWTCGGLGLSGVLALGVRRRERVSPWHLVTQVALTSVVLGALLLRRGFALTLLPAAGFVVAGVPLALIDLRTGRLPNWLLIVGYTLTVTGLLIAASGDVQGASLHGAALGAAGFALFYTALYIGLPGQLGGGDVKLSAAAGGVLGWHNWPTLLAELLLIWALTAVVHLLVRLTKDPQRQTLPHGPFLVLGTVVAVLAVP